MASYTRRPDRQEPELRGLPALRAAGLFALTPATAATVCRLDGWELHTAAAVLLDLDPFLFDQARERAFFRDGDADYRRASKALDYAPEHDMLNKALSRAQDATPPRLRFPAPPRDVMQWAIEKGFADNCPTLMAAWQAMPAPRPDTNASRSWPWGTHDTALLRHLAAAAEKFWGSNYDPTDPSTAPTNDQVTQWLIKRLVAKRVAEVMAQILRADRLPPGPR